MSPEALSPRSNAARGSAALSSGAWLAVFIEEAIDAAEKTPRTAAIPKRLDSLDDEIVDALWSRGLLFGLPSEGAPALPAGSETEAAFLAVVRFILTESASLLRARWPVTGTRARLRWQLGSVAAGLAGEFGVVAVLEEALREGSLAEEDERRLLSVAGEAIATRMYLLGNPSDGLPLHAAVAALDARAFIRLAAGQAVHGGSLRRRAERFGEQLSRAKATFLELIAGVFAVSSEETDPTWLRPAARQLRALSLLWRHRRTARLGLRSPRAPVDLMRPMAPSMRRLMIEQLILGALIARRWSPPVRAYVREAGRAAGVSERKLDLMESRSAAFLIQHERAALALSSASEHTMLDTALHAASDSMHQAADAIALEMEEAGELGATLARLARGDVLTGAERARMRAQLIDLAKVVPSLAIFAAPGGTLLLPLILKLLPSNLVPAAFQSRSTRPPPVSKSRV